MSSVEERVAKLEADVSALSANILSHIMAQQAAISSRRGAEGARGERGLTGATGPAGPKWSREEAIALFKEVFNELYNPAVVATVVGEKIAVDAALEKAIRHYFCKVWHRDYHSQTKDPNCEFCQA